MSYTFQIVQLPPPRPKEEVHAAAMARGARCDLCPLYGCGRGPVMGEIRPGAPMAIVGEAPGPNEVLARRPFVGWSGGILDLSLQEGGLLRDQCTVTNTILCQPAEGGNYTAYMNWLVQDWKRRVRIALRRGETPPDPPVMPQTACAPRLSRDIAESGSRVVLAVGKQALEATARELGCAQGHGQAQSGQPYVASIAKQHGAPVVLRDGRVLMSSYHPAMAARGRKEYLPVIRENLMRAAWVARHNGFIPWSEPEYSLNPAVAQVEKFCERLLSLGSEVTVDIETNNADVYSAHIRCVGLGSKTPGEEVMVVPFRHMDGTPWWQTQDEKVRAGLALREVFERNPLAGLQNGQFDTSVLLRYGLMLNRGKTWFDDMLAHHDTPDNDLPHDLGFIGRRFNILPLWKSDIDHKSVDNVNDATLHLYNARDVLVQMRLIEPLRAQIAHWGTAPQFDTDTRMAPIIRDMGQMGLVVDEAKRGEFSQSLNESCTRELKKFRELIGKPKFNPRSVPQLQELFFQEWGYPPVIGTDGYEIKTAPPGTETWQDQMRREEDQDEAELEGEVGSTSSAALIELMKKREMREEHVNAVKTLLEYRAFDKLRGTYVDNMPVRPIDWKGLGVEVPELEAINSIVWDPHFHIEDTEDWGAYVNKVTLAKRSALSLLNTTFKNHIVPTGRLASSGPNVQNFPALGKANMRDMIVAPPGHILVSADYAQLEARLYAVAARDALLLQAIRDKRDIHSMNAAALLAKTLNEIEYWYKRVELGEGIEPSKRKTYRKYWRTVAKRFAFLEIYGGQEDKLFSVMAAQRDKNTGLLDFPDLKMSDVETWHENWHRLHPETKRWHDECHAIQEQTGCAMVPALDYRKRFFLGGVSQKNAVPNMTIQGFASSIANRALLALVERIPFRSWSYWTGVNLQVHDMIGLTVPKDRGDEAKKTLEECMFYEFSGVPFPAEAVTAHRWSKMD